MSSIQTGGDGALESLSTDQLCVGFYLIAVTAITALGVTQVHKGTWMEAIVLLSQRKYTLKVIFTMLFKTPDIHKHTYTCNLYFSGACLDQTVSFIS